MNLKVGNPTYGELKLDYHEYRENLDEWVKNVLNKEIKRDIRQLPGSKFIHSISFEPTNSKASIKINFKSGTGYDQRRKLREGVQNYLKNSGYNEKRFDIEI